MSQERSPAFQFYPKDFLSDGRVAEMSLPERGAYITLLCVCWLEQTLPNNVDRLARVCGSSSAAFKRLWPALEPCFRVQVEDQNRLIHPRLEKERQKQLDYQRRQSDKGKASGVNRRATGTQPEGNHGSTGGATERQPKGNREATERQPEGNSSSPSPSPTPVKPKDHDHERVEDLAFEAFWTVYPKKKSRADAEKAWRKLAPSPELTQQILGAVAAQLGTPDWQQDGGRFVPYGATWLNGRRWEDEAVAAAEAFLAKSAEGWRCQHQPPCCNSAMHQVTLARERGEIT